MSIPPMYQIRPDILETLKCSECFCYLSCGPIKLQINGGLTCGRCLLPDDSFVVDTPYENVAKMLLFPCRNNKYGCKIQDAFNAIREHEENCDFKEYFCPIDSSCNWKGTQKDIYKHGEENHSEKVLNYPCLIPHMFNENHTKTYITSSNNLTFLIHVKVCLTSRKVFHCVRFVGDCNCASYFEFSLSMESQNSNLKKTMTVSPYNSFEIQENNSIVTSITGLQEIFGELQNINFVISVKELLDIIRCLDCQITIKKFVYKTSNGYKCENCLPEYEKCNNCDYKDFKTKLDKHNKYFCKNKQFSPNISVNLKNPISIICATNANLESEVDNYPDFFHDNGVFWKTNIGNFPRIAINRLGNVGIKVIHAIKYDFGYSLCEFYKFKQVHDSNVVIYFNIYAPLSSNELNLFDCHLVLSRPDKNFTFEGFLEREFELEADWSIKIDYFHYYDSCHDLDIKITFLPRDIYKHPKAVSN